MTDHNDTGAAASSWSYEIQYGPNDEEIYAWVYNHSLMVCTVKVHHARMIVEAVNAYEPLKARLAEVERERGVAREANKILAHGSLGEEILRKKAEARIAVLEKALEQIAYSAQADTAPILRGYAQDALAAEQKED